MPDLPDHWQYAFGCAAHALERWARTFNFRDEIGPHAYTGSDPNRMLGLIDAFLAEESTKCLGGNRRQLEELRPFVVASVLPVYQRGLAAGVKYWVTSGQEYGALEPEEIHAAAWARAEAEGELKDWFVEGFSVAYTQKELESLKEDLA